MPLTRPFILVALLTIVSCGGTKGDSSTPAPGDDDDSTTLTEVDVPTELAELAVFLFAQVDAPTLLDAGVAEARTQLAAPLGGEPAPLDEDSTSAVDRPDRALDDMLSVMLVRSSDFEPADHARHLILEDRTEVYDAYERYYRTVLEGSPDDFLAGAGRLVWSDDVLISNFGVEIPYTLDTVAVWVDDVIVVRRSLPVSSCSGSGDNCLLQSFGLDLYAPEGRFSAVWSETASPITVSDDLIQEAMTNGAEDAFAAEDAWLSR